MIRTPHLYCALDTVDLAQATEWAESLVGTIDGVKLGLEFFCAHGPAGVKAIQSFGLPIFLDLKLHDIPNTVAGALRAVAPLGVRLITLHAPGGAAMMQAAADAIQLGASSAGVAPASIIGVTVLTSLGDEDLAATGQIGPAADQVKRLAELSMASGLDGIVCSPHEAAAMRALLGPNALLITPGIRPSFASAGDQKRIMTPAQAVQAGADILVIGRPITEASDPQAAAAACRAEMLGAAQAA